MVRTAETYDRFEKPLANLLDVLQADLLRRRMDTEALCHERNQILRSWPQTRPPQTTLVAQRLPACDFLDVTEATAAHAPTHHIVAGLAPLLDLLHWSYSYPIHPKWPELGAHVAFAEIIGSRGLADGDEIHLGLTLMAPRTHYPIATCSANPYLTAMETLASWSPVPELEVNSVERREPGWLVAVDSRESACCPECGTQSSSRHSSYLRTLQDLSTQGTPVAIQAR
jgi:hypothetical protein